MLSLDFNVIAFDFTKLSKCILKSFDYINQLWKYLEPYAKKKASSKRKGAVGSIGRATPIIPSPINKKAKTMYNIFINKAFLIYHSEQCSL